MKPKKRLGSFLAITTPLCNGMLPFWKKNDFYNDNMAKIPLVCTKNTINLRADIHQKAILFWYQISHNVEDKTLLFSAERGVKVEWSNNKFMLHIMHIAHPFVLSLSWGLPTATYCRCLHVFSKPRDLAPIQYYTGLLLMGFNVVFYTYIISVCKHVSPMKFQNHNWICDLNKWTCH